MIEFRLDRRLSPISDIPFGIHMNGVPAPAVPSESNVGEIYWRFEDETDAQPQKLGEGVAGSKVNFPVDLKNRPIRLFLVSRTKSGARSIAAGDITQAVQLLFDPGAIPTTSETTAEAAANLAVNDLVYLYNDGTIKADKSDASDATKPVQWFVIEAATTGNPVRLFGPGNVMTGLTGRSPGANQYLSTTPGTMTESPAADPATDAGKLVQKIGVALSTTSVDFNPETGTVVIGTGGSVAYPPSALGLTDLGPSGGHESVQLDWTNNGGTGDNIIERDFNGGGFLAHATVAFNVATYNDLPLISLGPDVTYRVRNASVLGYSNAELISI
jgi:hypothetical protein